MPDTKALTPKQQRVHDLLKAGDEPAAVAKKMRITTSGVYGHMRNIRKLGVTLPGEHLDSSGDSNGDAPAEQPPLALTDFPNLSASDMTDIADMRATLSDAIKQTQARLAEIDREGQTLNARLGQLGEIRLVQEQQLELHERALAVYPAF